MKKDREWFIDKWTKERNKTHVHDPMYHFINEFIADVSQLDESEVLSKEWINEHITDGHNVSLGDKVVYADDLDGLLVSKQELPVIPKWVADSIESKKRVGTRLNVAMSEFPEFKLEKELGINEHECNELYARAWLDGYEVEEEQLYYALVKGHELSSNEFKYWNCKAYNSGHLLIGSKYPKASCINRMTMKHWNELGINDSNADFVKVDEELN